MNTALTLIPTSSERNLAGLTHVACLVLALATSWFAGFAGMLPALVVYLAQPDKQSFVARHAAAAFNFNFSAFVYFVAACLLAFLTLFLGLIVLLPLAVAFAAVWLICSIMAAVAAFRGDEYRYPFSIRLL